LATFIAVILFQYRGSRCHRQYSHHFHVLEFSLLEVSAAEDDC